MNDNIYVYDLPLSANWQRIKVEHWFVESDTVSELMLLTQFHIYDGEKWYAMPKFETPYYIPTSTLDNLDDEEENDD